MGLGFDLALTGFDAEEITGIQAAVAADGAEGDQFFFYGVKKPPRNAIREAVIRRMGRFGIQSVLGRSPNSHAYLIRYQSAA